MNSFRARGGWWVIVQMVVLSTASVVTRTTGYEGGWFDFPAQIIGILLMLGAGAMAMAGLIHLRDSVTPFPQPSTDKSLKTGGIYHHIRHPVYAAIIIGTFGWALWWMSAPGGLYAAVVALFLDRKAAREERWLRQRHPEYVTYAREVRRFVPGVY